MITLFVRLFYFDFQILPPSYPRECYAELTMREAGIWQIKAYFVKSLTLSFIDGYAICKS